MSDSRLKIVVMGYVVRGPLAGMAWSDLQYVDSLLTLGHDVVYVEDSDDYPSCYDPTTNATGTDPRYGLGFAETAFGSVGLADGWTFYDAHTATWLGPQASKGERLFADADVLLNLAGVNPLRDWSLAVRARVLVDQDPAFTQIRNLRDEARAAFARAHTTFFTFAENVGREDCTIPDDGLPWAPTRQPVIPDRYRTSETIGDGPFTTVMQWESYPELEFDGRTYGMKARSFESLADLPRRASARLELAIGAPTPVRERLEASGWSTRDPRPVTRDLESYVSFISGSRGEIGIAKHGYVSSRSGWFSERSLTYMSCGRAVVLQDTGFSSWLPTGEGVLAFGDQGEAAAAIEVVDADPLRHGRAARSIAAEYFDGRKVMSDLLEAAGSTRPADVRE